MLKELEQAGLSEKSAKVYLAALELGAATAEQLANHAKINRSTTYVQIESLSKMGLMTTYEEGKKTYFAPESPEYLHRIIARKRQELELKEKDLKGAIPELTRLFEGGGERPNVRFYDGKEGLVTIRNEALNVKEKIAFAIYSADSVSSVFSERELTNYTNNRDKRGVSSRALYTRKDGPFDTPPAPRTERVFIPSEELNLTTDILIFDDKVSIMSHKGKIFGVVVQGSEIAKSMHSIFELLWSKYESSIEKSQK